MHCVFPWFTFFQPLGNIFSDQIDTCTLFISNYPFINVLAASDSLMSFFSQIFFNWSVMLYALHLHFSDSRFRVFTFFIGYFADMLMYSPSFLHFKIGWFRCGERADEQASKRACVRASKKRNEHRWRFTASHVSSSFKRQN